jgi:hypothetical protein
VVYRWRLVKVILLMAELRELGLGRADRSYSALMVEGWFRVGCLRNDILAGMD